MDDWPFDQGPNVAAVTNAAVLAGAPILLAVHYSDDDSWGFFDGGAFELAQGRVVGMGEALRLDPSLTEIADLPPGYVARRSATHAPWVQELDPDI